MKKSYLIPVFIFVVSLILPSVILAGGFSVAVDVNPGSSYGKNAVLVVKPFGCNKPADAEISGTAEGILGGVRKSITLKFEKNEKGEAVLTKQWPDEGVWVIVINGSYNSMNSGAIVEIGNNYYLKAGKNKSVNPETKVFHRKIKSSDFEPVLKKFS